MGGGIEWEGEWSGRWRKSRSQLNKPGTISMGM